MKKTGKLLGSVIIVVFILGLVCIGTGIVTGAGKERIITVLNNRFQLESTLNLYAQYFHQLGALVSRFFR